MASESCDVLVIGCGGFGSAAMSHLAARGLRVVGIDRFHPPHDRGSSHGETRIIRKAYFEHPNYVPLLHRAWELWEELAYESRRSLIEQRDLLLSGAPGSPVIEGARQSAQMHSLPLEHLSREEALERYPMFSIPQEHSVTVEATAGILRAEQCIQSHLDRAARHGATLHCGEIVRSVNATLQGVTVSTDRASYRAAFAVLTCGAWTGQLLPEYARWISVLRKPLFWYPIRSELPSPADNRFPLFLLDLPAGMFYGIPDADGRSVKVAEHSGGRLVADPADLIRQAAPEEEEAVNKFVRECLNGVEPKSLRSTVCMYSMSPDGHFLVDRDPDLPLVTACGFSGHGFKFTSVLGEAVADLIQKGQSAFDLEFMSARRLKRPAP